MRRLFLAAIALALCTGVAFLLRSSAHQDSFPNFDTKSEKSAVQNDAAFRDGFYQGGLAAGRGNPVHIASGRWVSEAGQAGFTLGYQQAYIESFRARHQPATATNGAFRDGLYLGALAAKRGEEPRIAEGRWSSQPDRASFTYCGSSSRRQPHTLMTGKRVVGHVAQLRTARQEYGPQTGPLHRGQARIAV
jgi:hypothetical protein